MVSSLLAISYIFYKKAGGQYWLSTKELPLKRKRISSKRKYTHAEQSSASMVPTKNYFRTIAHNYLDAAYLRGRGKAGPDFDVNALTITSRCAQSSQ